MTNPITELDERRWRDPQGRFDALLSPALTASGLRLIRARVEGDKTPRLEVLVEPMDGKPLDLDRCAQVSRLLSATLDVADPITDKYMLDVGSGGADRPLTTTADFERFTGFTVKAKLTQKTDDGRAKLKGSLKGLSADGIDLTMEDGTPLTVAPARIADIHIVADDYYFDRVKKGTYPKLPTIEDTQSEGEQK